MNIEIVIIALKTADAKQAGFHLAMSIQQTLTFRDSSVKLRLGHHHVLCKRHSVPPFPRLRASPSDVFVLDLGSVLCERAKMKNSLARVRETLAYCEAPFYIVTDNSAAQASKLLQERLGLDIPQGSSRLFASLDPFSSQKAEALRSIGSRPLCKETGARLHYVDDQLSIVQQLSTMTFNETWKFYLADWGDNTESDFKLARGMGITVLNITQFCELLKWGILMGVDDGCEPTPEEVQAQIFKEL